MNYSVAQEIIWSLDKSLPFEGFLHNKEKGVMCNPGKQNDKVFSCEYIPPVQNVEDKANLPKREEVFTLKDLENKPNAFIMAMPLPTQELAEFKNLWYYLPHVNEEEKHCGVGDAVDVADIVGGSVDVVADDNRV